jgi:hypothetical protein
MATYQDADNPDEDFVNDLLDALDTLGVEPDTSMIVGPKGLRESDGWRGTGFINVDKMIEYVTDGGIESMCLFVWDAVEKVWFIYVDY